MGRMPNDNQNAVNADANAVRAHRRTPAPVLLAAAEALFEARDNQMVTAAEWRGCGVRYAGLGGPADAPINESSTPEALNKGLSVFTGCVAPRARPARTRPEENVSCRRRRTNAKTKTAKQA